MNGVGPGLQLPVRHARYRRGGVVRDPPVMTSNEPNLRPLFSPGENKMENYSITLSRIQFQRDAAGVVMYSGAPRQYGGSQYAGGSQYGGRPSAPTPITGASPPPGDSRQYLPAHRL